MTCRLLVLFAIGGCGTVFQLQEIDPAAPAPCGPYHSVTPVTIQGVTDASHFSITPDGTLAMVVGRVGGGPLLPVPLRQVGGAWQPDTSLTKGLSQIIDFAGANLAPPELQPVATDYTMMPKEPVMMVWSGSPNQLARYYFSSATQTWTLDPNITPISDGDYDVRAGNVNVVIGNGGVDDLVRHVVQVKRALDPTKEANQILLSANTPPMFSLSTKPDRTRPLNDARLETGQAVLTEAMNKLVYDARAATSTDIYASERTSANDFEPGPQVGGINTAADEVEPWVDATCQKLYFRRRAAGQPNDAGQIFVAE